MFYLIFNSYFLRKLKTATCTCICKFMLNCDWSLDSESKIKRDIHSIIVVTLHDMQDISKQVFVYLFLHVNSSIQAV